MRIYSWFSLIALSANSPESLDEALYAPSQVRVISSLEQGEPPAHALFLCSFPDGLAYLSVILSFQEASPVLQICIKAGRDSNNVAVESQKGLFHLCQIPALVHVQILEVLVYRPGVD